jgi:hypothetical protein
MDLLVPLVPLVQNPFDHGGDPFDFCFCLSMTLLLVQHLLTLQGSKVSQAHC